MALLAVVRRASARLGIFIGILCCSNAGSAAPPLKLYGSLPGIEAAALSASGDKVAVIGIVAEQRKLIVADIRNKPLFTAQLGDVKVSNLTWAGDDIVLLGLRSTANLGIDFTSDKAELETYMVVPLKGGTPWHVFRGNKGITGGVTGFFGVAQREGHWFGYFGGITYERSLGGTGYLYSTDPDLYEVDLADQGIRRIAKKTEVEYGYRRWLVDQSGSVVATFDHNQSSSGSWRLRDAEGRELASGKAGIGEAYLVSLGRSPHTMLYSITDSASGADHWIEAGGTAPEEILADKPITRALIDRTSRQLIGYVEDGDYPMARFFDARRTKVMEATRRAFPNMNVELVDCNASFDRLIVTTDGPGDPGSWWYVDIKTGDARDLGISYPMKAADVGAVRMISYKAADGLQMAGVLTLPPGREAKNLPVVILPHGGPTARDYPQFDWWAQALASRGYAVFQPNFRGSAGYGSAFEQAGHGEWGRKMQTDISDGFAELVRQGIVDARRACIMGGSYGGYAALAGVTLQQGLYRCAVSVAGVSDVAKMIATENRESGSNVQLRRALKNEVGSGKDLKLVSPANFADRADAPILLIHGKDDTVVDFQQSEIMLAALRKAGKPVEMVTLRGEDHWLSRSATRLAMLEAAVAFVEKHNPADPPKD